MQSKVNYSDQSIMQLELFPNPVLKSCSPKQLKTFTKTKTLPLIQERINFTADLLSRCRAFGHCSIGIISALSCLYIEVETYSKEEFLKDIQPYL